MTARVREGIFFNVPRVLPRGRHSLTREQVLAVQRERLMAAMTELLAARGYLAVKIGEVAERAGVSRAAFYQCFSDKDACAFAAYDRFIEVLLGRLAAAGRGHTDWEAFLAALVEAYLGTLHEDLVVARAFQVEMDAAGAPARERRRAALVRFAEFIRTHRERLAADVGDAGPRSLPLSAYLGAVYAARQIASDAVDTQRSPDLLALAPELAGWITDLLRPTSGAAPLTPAGRGRRAVDV